MLHASARQCSLVLEKLGHIKSDGSMELKGHAACLIDTGNELLVSEVMFDGEITTLVISKFILTVRLTIFIL